MLISIVIPCYNSERSIREVVELTMQEISYLQGYDCEFILVNDCSKDNTFEEIQRLGKDYPNVKGINLMRNFGQHAALMCAMNYASGDYVLGMDDDLQTHPSQIPILVKKIEEGYDLVYGVYRNSTNTKKKNLTSWFNKVSSRILLGRPKEIRSSNFWLITSKVRDEVIKYTNNNPYVDGIFFRTTHNIANVEIEHHRREYGASGYTFRKMLKLWMAYWNFSVVPLRLASFMGIITAFMGFIATIVTIISKLIDPSAPIGWPSLICVILVFFGFTLLVLGIIGEYIGELILAINRTPQFIVRDTVNLETKTTEV